MINLFKTTYADYKHKIPDVFWMFVYAGGKHIFIIGVFFIAAAMLTPYDFGLYNYITAILLLLILFGDFGISAAASKHIAELKALNAENERSVVFNASILSTLFVVIVVAGILLLAPAALGEKSKYIFSLLPSLICFPLAYLYTGIYRGVGKFKAVARIIFFTAFFSLFCSYFLIKIYGLYGALWANNLFSFLFLILLIIGHREWHSKFDIKMIKQLGAYSLILGITSFSYFLYSRVDIIMLGHFGHISEIGFYELLNKILLLLAAPFMIISQVIAPKIAGLNAHKKFAEIFQKYQHFVLISFIVSCLVTFISFLVFPIIFKHYFPQYVGVKFITAIYLMLVLLISQSVATIAATGFSISTGHARINMNFLLFFGIINIPITYFFIKTWGFMGAVYATVAVRLLTDMLFVAFYYIKIKKHAEAIA